MGHEEFMEIERKNKEGRQLESFSMTSDQDERVAEIAKEIRTRSYLKNGFIEPEEIGSDGVYRDKYDERSTYILAADDRRLSACRYIKAENTSKGPLLSLPTASYFPVDPEILKTVARVSRLSDIRAKHVVEISALASEKRGDAKVESLRSEIEVTKLAYATLLRESLDNGHKLWLLNTHPELIRSLQILLGKDQVTVIGEPKDYMGSVTLPAAINPQEVVLSTLTDTSLQGQRNKKHLKQTLQGVSDKYLSKDLIQALNDNEIEHSEPRGIHKAYRYRRELAATALVAWAAGRALPIGAIEEFSGSPAMFFALDVATIPSYVWGLDQTLSGKTPAKRLIGASVASVSFAAPYAYFWSQGEGYPFFVNAAIGGYIGAVGALELRKVVKDKQIAKALEESTENEDS